MKPHQRLSRAANLVEAFEAFEARAVARPEGGWVIGYGHTASAREGASVSRQDARALLLYDLGRVAEVIEASIFAPLNANQFEALASFAFNIGDDNFRCSTALRRLNAGDYHGAAREIERWRRAELSGEAQVVDVLIRRRAAEKALFLTPPEGFPKAVAGSLHPAFDPDLGVDGAAGELGHSAEPASATLAAAEGVTARLRALVPEPEARSETPTRADPSPPFGDFEAAELEAADTDHTPWPSSIEYVGGAEPAPDSTDRAFKDEDAPISTIEEDAPPPPPFVHDMAAEAFASPAPANEFTETPPQPSLYAETLARPEPVFLQPRSYSKPSFRSRAATLLGNRKVRRAAIFALGVLGVILFAAAIALIVSGRPVGLELALGLLGIAAITPSAYLLLGVRRQKPR